MRQVPTNKDFLLIGSGRLARHLCFYFDSLNMKFTKWNRQDHSSADLIQRLKNHKFVLLCINDNQIPQFIDDFKNDSNIFVHFSGALEHPKAYGFHPLMTFGQDLYELEVYKSLNFVGSHSEDCFRLIFPELPNLYHTIEANHKSLYHSLCVLSGNGTTLLWDLIAKEFEKMGLDHRILKPYLKQVTKNILDDSQGRWSGPWYRNDQSTIEGNLKALEAIDLKPLYSELEKMSHNSGHFNEKH